MRKIDAQVSLSIYIFNALLLFHLLFRKHQKHQIYLFILANKNEITYIRALKILSYICMKHSINNLSSLHSS